MARYIDADLLISNLSAGCNPELIPKGAAE